MTCRQRSWTRSRSFSINYNKMRGRVFEPTARGSAAEGMKFVKRSTAKVAKKKRWRFARLVESD